MQGPAQQGLDIGEECFRFFQIKTSAPHMQLVSFNNSNEAFFKFSEMQKHPPYTDDIHNFN